MKAFHLSAQTFSIRIAAVSLGGYFVVIVPDAVQKQIDEQDTEASSDGDLATWNV